MWKATVQVDQSVTVRIDPESAWSLLSSPPSWPARPGATMVFDVADPVRPPGAQPPDPGRLRFVLGELGGRPYALVLAVTAETPGQTVSLEAFGGRASWDLSVQPARRGSALRIAASVTVGRTAQVDAEARLRADVKQWLSTLRDIADGRRPRPDGVPEQLRQACLAFPSLVWQGVEATVSTVIDAPSDLVRHVYRAAEITRLVQPPDVLCFGPVPGTPGDGEVGTMRYFVVRSPDGQLDGRVSLLAASSPGGSVERFVTAPFGEQVYRFEPAGAGTRLEISVWWPGNRGADLDARREQHAQVSELAGRLKNAIESLAAAGS